METNMVINALAAFTFTLHKSNSHSWRHLQDRVLSTGGRLACSLAAGSLLARSGQNMPYKTKNQLKQEEPTCSVGVPRIRKILNNWSISESPWTDKMCVEKMQKKRWTENLEKRFGSYHLSHNGAQWPNVNRGGVLGTAKQDFRSSGKRGESMFEPRRNMLKYWEASSPVPQGDHLMSVNPDRNSKGTGKSKISNFDHLWVW